MGKGKYGWLWNLGGGIANAGFWDMVMNSNDYTNTDHIGRRLLLGAMNAGAGAMGTHNLRSKKAKDKYIGAGMIMLSPAKDLMVSAIPKLDTFADAAQTYTNTAGKSDVSNTALNLVIGGLGLGALGLGGYGLHKWLQKKDEEAKKKEKGHIKIRVRGKDGDPNKTMDVMLPVDNPELTPAMLEGLNMSLRRNAKEVIRANSLKKDPNTGKLIPYEEWKARYGNGQHTGLEFNKMSSWLPFYPTEQEPMKPVEDPNAPVVLRRIVGPTITEYQLPSSATKSTLTPEVVAAILSGAPVTQAQQLNDSYAATGSDTPSSFDDDDDDFDKLAGQGPPPPPPGPGGPGGPPPPPGAPVSPEANKPAPGLPPRGNSNSIREASARLASILTKIRQQRNMK